MESFLNNWNKKSNISVKSEVLRRGQPPQIRNNFCPDLIFNVVPYFQLEKNLFFTFNNNHKPKTYNIFSSLSPKNHS